ncbi:MAG: hypothetical protein GXO42_00085 [bacterium]|nr:hypothetical protein [bacterium]
MRFQVSLEYLVILAAILALGGAVLIEAVQLFHQYKMFVKMVNAFYNTTYKVLIS